MRRLSLRDAGKASKILKKLGLRINDEGDVRSAEALGASLFLVALENYHQAEQEVAELMASLIGDGMTEERFLDLTLDEAMPYFEKLKEDPGLKGFFKLLGKLS